jgi:ABC-type dipeptide/oligopeptide/nickel transport system permease subunit
MATRRGALAEGWSAVWAQRSARWGMGIVLAYVLAALFAPWLATHDPVQQAVEASMQPPSAAHWLGTDSFGQDIYSRLLYGARLALVIGFGSVLLGMVAGVALGLLAGLAGGRIEWTIMRVVDGLLAFPELILAMAFLAVLGPGVDNLVYALALSFVGPFARTVRSDVLQVRALWPEAGVRFGAGRLARLEVELDRMARFAGCDRVGFDDGWLRGVPG